MTKPLLSPATLRAFEDELNRESLSVIRNIFEDAGIFPAGTYDAPTSGVRRHLVNWYYQAVDLTDPGQVCKLLDAFEESLHRFGEFLAEMDSIEPIPWRRKDYQRLVRLLGVDGFEYRGGKILPMGRAPALTHLRSIAVEVDYPYLLKELDRIEKSVETDPHQAIGTSKELLETVCKTILLETPGAKAIDKDWKLSQLCGATLEVLRLTPASVPEAAAARQTIAALLGQLGQIPQRLAELRNPFGSGHGHEGRAVGLEPRHARLAIGAASTLALFLFETHRDRRNPGEG